MARMVMGITVCAACAWLAGCGDGYDGYDHGYGGPGPQALTQYQAPTDNVFVAATDPTNPGITYGPTQGTYAGARLFITADVVAGSPTTQDQADYAQLYKASDGHVYGVYLLAPGPTQAVQVSSESNATIDDTCSLNGANTALGTDVNYVAVQSYVDYAVPGNSVYFYRLPGPDGACNTADDVVYMIKVGMGPADAPILARMPFAVVHAPATGAITGFVVNEGSALTLYDQNFQNRTVLYTPTTPIQAAYSLASTGVTATGGLVALDAAIVYVDYVHEAVSPAVFTVPDYDPGKRLVHSANGTTLYFAVDTTNEAATPVARSSAVYAMPLDGSAPPVALATESGEVQAVAIATYGSTVAWSVVPPGGSYTLRTFASGATAPVTALVAPANAGSFVVTAGDIYYTASTYSAPAANTAVYSGTQTGIVGMDGTVVQPPLANSRFVAEQRDDDGSDWLALVRARNLAPVTVADTANGITYTEDGISGATLEVVDTSTNAVTVTLGTLPAGMVMQGTGTLVETAGYIDGINVNSTADPATRELYYVDLSQPNSLDVLTSHLN